jgi:hypothetical protein
LNVLVIHAPIADHEVYPGGEFINAEKFLDKNDFDMILCGDIHRELRIIKKSKILVNTAPMLRIEAEEYNLNRKPYFLIYDSQLWNLVDEIEFPAKSGREVLTRKHIESEKKINEMLKDFVESLQDDGEVGEVDIIARLMKKVEKAPKEVKEIIIEIMGGINGLATDKKKGR